MDIFKKYTRRCLKTNRSRTLVTIIGIVLSMALLTAVIEGAYSGIQFLIRSEEKRSGKYEIYFSDLSPEQYVGLSRDGEIKSFTSWEEVGWARVETDNDLKTYLHIESVPADVTDFLSVNVTLGRLAEGPDEIVIPNHLAANGGLQYKLGDIINLSVGQRSDAFGKRINDATAYMGSDEQITDAVTKTYTVVGFYERPDYNVEARMSPGYTALTAGYEGAGYSGIFATLKHPSKVYSYAVELGSNYEIHVHSDLMTYKGTVSNGGIQAVIYGFMVILVVMIAFGSVSLIYNSFSISLSERTRQFGILKSVGATKKQLRSAALYEAMILSCIGIPIGLVVGCLGIGITLYCLRDNFNSFTGVSGVQMSLVLSPAALIASAVICLLVILISAWIPAGRAVRIPAIDSIRQSRDTKISNREVKTSKLTQKLFGFEGTMAAKNFKRNRKRYRITVVSLFMSIVLFISASSFCSYLTDAVGGVASDGNEMDLYYYSYTDPDAVLKAYDLTKDMKGIDRSSYAAYVSAQMWTEAGNLSAANRKFYIENAGMDADLPDSEPVPLNLSAAFIMDEEFDEIINGSRLNRTDYYDKSSPKGVIYNHIVEQGYGKKGTKWFSMDLLDPSCFPVNISGRSLKQFDGYVDYPINGADGVTIEYWYFPTEYLEEYWKDHDDTDHLDRSRGFMLSEEEAYVSADFYVNAAVSSNSFVLSVNEPCILYPYSMMGNVLAGGEERDAMLNSAYLGIGARDYSKVYEEMKEVFLSNGLNTENLRNLAESRNSSRMMVTIVNVFSYGFIILISLIALANVFNTISTSIMLRRREFAMLKSIGLSGRGFSRMMNYESMIYGLRSLMFGIPAAILMTVWIWRVTGNAFDSGFYIPWHGVVIAVASVFIVVFATMLYSTHRIRKDNPIDALRNENL